MRNVIASVGGSIGCAGKGTVTVDHLRRVQARREWPTRVTQKIQLVIQNRVVKAVLSSTERPKRRMVLRKIGDPSSATPIPSTSTSARPRSPGRRRSLDRRRVR